MYVMVVCVMVIVYRVSEVYLVKMENKEQQDLL